MAVETIELKCPYCGAPVSLETKVCAYCSSPVMIRTVNSVFSSSDNKNNSCSNVSSVINFIKAGLYDKAIAFCESAIQENFNNSDAYFYAAIASLKGKRPFLASASSIKKAEEYLQVATAIESKGIYSYLWAYIRFDHHFKKFYKASPDYKELHSNATKAGLSQADVDELFNILDVERPSEL